MNYYQKNYLAEQENLLEKYEKALKGARKVQKALKGYTAKTINKTWNRKSGFVTYIESWGRDTVKYEIKPARYVIGDDVLEMYIDGETVRLENRETGHVTVRVDEHIKNMKTWVATTKKRIAKCNEIDVEKMSEEIKKHKGDMDSTLWEIILKEARY